MELQKYVVTRMNKKTGEITIEALNILGPPCMQATKFAEKALGGKKLATKLKLEYYEGESETNVEFVNASCEC